MYHVGANGWTQVHKGDTNDMYYGYYPIQPKVIEAGETAQEIADAEMDV